MKKSAFTSLCSMMTLSLIIFSCTKEENKKAIGVGYGSTGNTGTTTSATTTTGPVAPDYGHITVNGNQQNLNIVHCGVNSPSTTYQSMGLTPEGRSVIVLFGSTPSGPGSYNITSNNTPGANQVKVTYGSNSVNYYAKSGIVKVSMYNGKISTRFVDIACQGAGATYTVTATVQCP